MLLRWLCVVLALSSALAGRAATFTVTNTLDSGPFSFRQAIHSANAAPGPHTISFNIPGPGPYLLQPVTELPALTNSVSIDGRTQPGYAGLPLIRLDGSLGGAINGLTLQAPNCVVVGLAIVKFDGAGGNAGLVLTGVSASGNWIHGNHIGLDPSGTNAAANYHGVLLMNGAHHNRIGTDGNGLNDVAERNLIGGNLGAGLLFFDAPSNCVAGNYVGLDRSGAFAIGNGDGVYVDSSATGNLIGTDSSNDPFNGSERNVISGNRNRGVVLQGASRLSGNFIGTDAAGVFAVPNPTGVQVTQRGGIVGTDDDVNHDQEERNVISGNTIAGISVRDPGTRDAVVRGNYVGTDPSGLVALPNGEGLVITSQATNTLVHDNLVSGNRFDGVVIDGGACGSILTANLIGTDADATNALGNGQAGVLIDGAANNRIGGGAFGSGNLIAFNDGAGIFVQGATALRNCILGNGIFGNGGLGIDLAATGPTTNDPTDTDTGPNLLQNFPVLTAVVSATDTLIIASLPGASSGPYLIQFFVSPLADPSGFGEGQRLIGSGSVPSGVGSFSVMLGQVVPVGHWITATATDPLGNTSEFSPAQQVRAPVPVISAQPVGGAFPCGSNFMLSVTATGSPPLTYQWRRNLGPLAGRTNATLGLTASPATAGAYSVVVNDAYGSVTSAVAVVTIVDTVPPVLTCAANLVVECGNSWSFTSPTAFDACGGTNVTVLTVSTVTNAGACPARLTVTRTWRATDSSSNSAMCSQTVTVVDTTPPVITCAAGKTIECGTAWTFDPPSATDICDGTNLTFSIVSTVTNAQCGRTYTATQTWRATDSCTNASQCSQTVTVVDTTPPVITCESNRVVECGVVWSFTSPTANDLCGGTNVVIAIVSTVTNTAACPVRLTATRTWRATDSCSNSVTCSQTVTVVDTTFPVLNCASNLVVECGNAWNFTAPTANDVCGGTNVFITIVSTVTNAAVCPAKLTARCVWQVTDSCFNSVTCSQTVTVVDTTPPFATPASDLLVECGTAWSFSPPVAFDACDGTNIVITIVSTVTNATACPARLTATRTWRATDSCLNAVTWSQTVTVLDTTPPVLVGVPAPVNVQCAASLPSLPAVTATDNCDAAPVVTRFSTTNGNCPIVIVHTWTARDSCSNTASASVTNTVRDTVPPVLVGLPANTNYQCLATVPPPPAGFATDNCDTNPLVFFSATTSGFAPRVITRTWTALDACTNVTTGVQIITVNDTIPPTLACASSFTVECGMAWNFAQLSASDNCDGTNLVVVIVNTTTNAFCGQTYSATRVWRATDSHTNASQCSQTVTVVDTTPPVITCVAGKTIECGTAWAFDPPSATDICDGTNLTITVVGTVTNAQCGRTFTATRTWRATDSCTNASQCSQTVVVVDTIAPAITCVADKTIECGTAWAFDPPSATDICDGTNLTFSIVSTVTNAECGRTFTATRTWRATDSCSNIAQCSQTVTVVDTTAPVITCASNRIVECGVAWNFNPPTATDICDGTNLTIIIVNTVTNPLVGQTFSATRTWRAIDSCTNSSACSQTVTIVDTTPPVVVCSTNITVECAGPPGTVVTYVTTASDVCDTNVAIVCTPPSGSTFVLGLTTVRCVGTDDSGNTNGCTFTVRVRDTTPPTIVCPANIIAAEFPRDGGSATVTFAAPVTGDICDSSLAVACVPPSGTAFPVGYTTVTCTARDDSSNSTSCTFVIRVIAYRLTVITAADALAGSLRQALLDANDAPGENLIQFNLPGAAPHRIALVGALPVITSPVILNGASQPGYAGNPVVELDGSGAGSPDGLIVRAGSSTIRGLALQGFATALRLETNGGNLVQGNFIGLNASGTVGPGNTGDGILIRSSANVIGGTNSVQRNVIAGNAGSGAVLDTPAATSNALRGNFIGVAPDGQTSAGNGAEGVNITAGAARNSLGGTGAGVANLIGFNGRNGIAMPSGGAQNAIRANVIRANALLGIDLGAAGPTPNDAGDADAGPNTLQNFPVLSDAVSADGVTTIDGTLNSFPSRTYQIDLFLNDTADPSGFGEAEVYLGSTSVSTRADGTGEFSVSFPVTATFIQFVSATATDPTGNSSEFSPSLLVRTPPVLEMQPVATNAVPGEPATLCAEASGTGPIYYQWRHNGQNIPGATNACYTLSISEVADGGTYDVVIYNVLGARETDSVPLTVPLDTLTAGDNYADAVPITGTNGLVSWQNRTASREAGEPRHAGKPGGKSVWYKWSPVKTGITTVRTRGSTFDTLLGVYEGTSVTNLVAVAFDEDRGGFYTSGVRFNALKRHTYYIAVDGFGDASGEFVFAWSHEKTKKLLPILDSQPLSQTVGQGGMARFTILCECVCGEGHRKNDCPDWEPDECEEDDDGNLEHDHHHHPAHLPAGLSYQWFFNGVAIPGADYPSLTISNVQPAHVGTYTVQVSTKYNRTTESQDAILQINDTGTAVQPVQAMDKFLDAAVAAEPLRLGNLGAGFAPSGGDGFQPAAVVRGYTGTQVFNTTTASTEGGEEPICGVLGGKSEWITFLGDESGTLALNTDGSTYDTVMAVFIRNPTNNALLKLVGCDNNSGTDGRDSSLQIPVLAGQTNFIVVDGVNSASGTLRLNFSLLTQAGVSSQGFTIQRAHKLRVTSRVGAKFAIQTSSNLVNWTTLFITTNAPTNPFDYTDAGSTSAPVRFYRAQMLP